jgi:hypothetical protein
MPQLTITETYADGSVLSASNLNSAFSSIENFVNSTGLDNTNVQAGGLLGVNLAEQAVTTAKLASGCITTALIAPGSVGQAQRAALNISSLSSSSGTFSCSVDSFTPILNLSCSITTNGRPVCIFIQDDGTQNTNGSQGSYFNTTGTSATIILKRGTLAVSGFLIETIGAVSYTLPPCYRFIDTPPAGTYTYTFGAIVPSGTLYVYYAQCGAYEIT